MLHAENISTMVTAMYEISRVQWHRNSQSFDKMHRKTNLEIEHNKNIMEKSHTGMLLLTVCDTTHEELNSKIKVRSPPSATCRTDDYRPVQNNPHG